MEEANQKRGRVRFGPCDIGSSDLSAAGHDRRMRSPELLPLCSVAALADAPRKQNGVPFSRTARYQETAIVGWTFWTVAFG